MPLHELSADARRLLLQHAVLLSFVDGEQDASEKKLIEELCEVLRIPGIESQGPGGRCRRARQVTAQAAVTPARRVARLITERWVRFFKRSISFRSAIGLKGFV